MRSVNLRLILFLRIYRISRLILIRISNLIHLLRILYVPRPNLIPRLVPALRLFVLLSAIGMASSACHTTKKLTAPAVSVVLADTLPTLPLSVIDIPIKVAGRPILRMMDSLVPKEFTSDGWPAYLQPSCDFRYKWRFVRSALIIGCVNNKFSLQMTGNYQVAGGKCICTLGKPVSPWISGNCGFGSEPMRRVDIGISSLFLLQPDYKVRTQTRLYQLKPVDNCIMSIFSMDMTQLIIDSIRSSINGFCTNLDQTVAGLDFKAYLRQTSAMAYQPTAIGPYGYLTVNPTAIRVGWLNYDRDTFRIKVGLSCRPELSSENDSRKNIPSLPPLSPAGPQNGISLYLHAAYDYKFLSKMANDSLRNRSFLVKGRTVTVKEVTIRGKNNHQVEIKIEFAGSYKGTATLTGTPVLDTAKQSLTIPDIAYTLDSKDMLLKMAKTFMGRKIRRNLQGNSYVDLKALLKANMPAINAQLNKQLSPNLSSSGAVQDIRLIGLLPNEKNMQAQLQIIASLAVTSTGIPDK